MATHTIWVDPVSGNDANNGLTFATAVAGPAGIATLVASYGSGHDIIINLADTGDHTWTTTTLITTANNTYTFRGRSSSDTPAWATAYHSTGSGNTTTNLYLRFADHDGITFEYIKFDATSFATPSGFTMVGAYGPTAGNVVTRYCQFLGDDAADETTFTCALRSYARSTSTGTNTEDVTYEYCYIQKCRVQLELSTTITSSIHDCVILCNEMRGSIFGVYNYYGAGEFYNNTVYYNASAASSGTYAPAATPIVAFNSISTDPYPASILRDNVFWREIDPDLTVGTLTEASAVFTGNVGFSNSFASGTVIGNNLMTLGPITGAIDVSALGGYVYNPFEPPLSGSLYSGDIHDKNIADSTLFVDPSSTYAWTPSGSSLAITVAKDLRLASYITMSSTGGPPGAMGGIASDWTVTITSSLSNPIAGETITLSGALANGGPFDSEDTVATLSSTSGLTIVSATPSQGTFNSSTGEWAIGTLANGNTATISLTVQVGLDQGGNTLTPTLAFTSATIGAASPTADDTASVTLNVQENVVSDPDSPAQVPFIDVLPLKQPVLDLQLNMSLRTTRNRAREIYHRYDIERSSWYETRAMKYTLGTSETKTFNLGGIQRAKILFVESEDNAVQVSINATDEFSPSTKFYALSGGTIESLTIKNPSSSETASIYILVVD